MSEWRDVPGLEDYYQISNDGKGRSKDRRVKAGYGKTRFQKGRLLKPRKTKNGYLRFCFAVDGVRQDYYVHRLVAEAFIPNPDNLPEVNHKSQDKTDNRVENIEWCNRSYNNNYGDKNKRMLETSKKNGSYKKALDTKRNSGHFTEIYTKGLETKKERGLLKKIEQLDLQGNLINCYESINEAARETGCNNAHICACCKGKLSKHKGYKWRYAS